MTIREAVTIIVGVVRVRPLVVYQSYAASENHVTQPNANAIISQKIQNGKRLSIGRLERRMPRVNSTHKMFLVLRF